METALIVIGASLGGLNAIETILQGLPHEFPIPLAIVLHRTAESKTELISHLQRHSALPVAEPEDKDTITTCRAYLAPADYHLLVEAGYFALSIDEPVMHARPSIDALFESAAVAYGRKTLGIVLTSASPDGASGAALIKQRGGIIVVQDPVTAASDVLPKAVISLCKPDYVLPLHSIPSLLVDLFPTERSTSHV